MVKIAIYSSIGKNRGQDTETQLAELRRRVLSKYSAIDLFVDREDDKTSDRGELSGYSSLPRAASFKLCWYGPWIAW